MRILTGASDLANIAVDWEVEGIISVEESVSAMIGVIETRTIHDSGKFYTWEGKVLAWRLPYLRVNADFLIRSTRGRTDHNRQWC